MKFLAEDIKEVAVEIVQMIPERYFYKPEVDGKDFQVVRQELNDLLRKRQFSAYQSDRGIEHKIKVKQGQYAEMVADLVAHKRDQLLQELFTRSEQAQVEFLEKVIKRFNLKRYMGLFR